jgi:hypothetical protein
MGLTLRQLLVATGNIKEASEDLLAKAFEYSEDLRWRGNVDNTPHGHPWHSSFHASSFPGDDELACPRQALYTLMDFAGSEPFSMRSRLFMEGGKAGELTLTRAYADYGVLISTDQSRRGRQHVQTGFEDPEHWLTGNADALLLPHFHRDPRPLEIKFKRHGAVLEMRQGLRDPDPKHVRQLKTYMAGMHLHLHKTLSQVVICGVSGHVAEHITEGPCRMHGTPDCLTTTKLEPIQRGALLYVSFDDPDYTREFPIDLDLPFYYEGLRKLKQWKEWFLADHLPSLAPTTGTRGHPNGKGWGWSKLPCKWCSVRSVCRQDHNDGIDVLSKSAGVAQTKEVRAPVGHTYDPRATRQAVIERWAPQEEMKLAA